MTPVAMAVLLFKISAVLVLAAASAALLRRKPAALKHAVWAASIVASLLLSAASVPAFDKLAPRWTVAPVPFASLLDAKPAPGPQSGSSQIPITRVRAATDAPERRLTSFASTVWLAGAALMLFRLTLGWAALRRISTRAVPVSEARTLSTAADVQSLLRIGRRIRLLGAVSCAPVTWGLLAPRILLPADHQTWPSESLRAVIIHEYAHIRRFDWAWQTAAELLLAIYWFHPLAWLAVRRLRQQSEYACDDAVLRSGAEPSRYASTILRIARSFQMPRIAATAGMAVARSSHLERRFTAMLNTNRNRGRLERRGALLTATLSIAALLPLASLRLPAQETPARFSGNVFDDQSRPAVNATVILTGLDPHRNFATVTGRDGAFEFAALPTGQYNALVLKPGFAAHSMPVQILSGQNAATSLNLTPGEPFTTRVADNAGRPSQIHVAGSVQAANLIGRVTPVYPSEAKSARVQGSVELSALINTSGEVERIAVEDDPDPDLARAAVTAVNQWRYKPTLLNGEPIDVMTKIEVNFTLAP